MASQNVGCFITLTYSRPSDSRERREVKNARKNERDWRELSSLFLCLCRFHFFFFCPLFYLASLRPGQLLCHSLALGAQIFIPYWIAFHIAIAYNVDIDKNSSFPNTCSVPRALILCPNPFLSWVINLADRRPLRGNFLIFNLLFMGQPKSMPPYFQWQAKRAKKKAASERQSHAPHFRVFFRVPTRHPLNRLLPCCINGRGGVVTFNIRIFENCKAYFNFPTHTTSIRLMMDL